MLDNDQGECICGEQGYRATLSDIFEEVQMAIREDYARVPYLRGWTRREDGQLNDISPASASAKSAMVPADPCRRTQRTL
jgi:hypothetical protein